MPSAQTDIAALSALNKRFIAQLTSVAPQNYPPDDTIVLRYLRGVLQEE